MALTEGLRRDLPTGVKFRCSFRNTVYDVLRNRGWIEAPHNGAGWDILWCDRDWMHEVYDKAHLGPKQRINHFRNHYELTRKDLLTKNLKKCRRQIERSSTFALPTAPFHPATFVLPSEYAIFVEEFKKTLNSTWIMKPIGKSQGKGIFLFDKLHQISEWKNEARWKTSKEVKVPSKREVQSIASPEAYVVQKYIKDPLLVGGKKFDLRIYTLVTSFSPLVVYIHREGFARFSHTPFSMDEEHISDLSMHLTNVAVQKKHENYNEISGGKWSMYRLKKFLKYRYGPQRVQQLMDDISSVILQSLLAVQNVMIQDKHCFELYGYDIILDKDLKPWLLEVNSSPSLSATTPMDYKLKFQMLDDALSAVDIEKELTGSERVVGGFDLVYRGAAVDSPAKMGKLEESIRLNEFSHSSNTYIGKHAV